MGPSKCNNVKPDEGGGGVGGGVGRVEALAAAVEEEGVGARREAAAGVVVDGRVGAAGREGDGEREREAGEALAGASPRLAHREGAGGGGRRRRRRVQRLLRYREFGDGRFEVAGGVSRWLRFGVRRNQNQNMASPVLARLSVKSGS